MLHGLFHLRGAECFGGFAISFSCKLNFLKISASRTLLAHLKSCSYSCGGLVSTANLHGYLLKKTKEMFSLALPERQHGPRDGWSPQIVICRDDRSNPSTEFSMSSVTSIAQCTCDSRAGSGLFLPFYHFI